jgi:ferredoxin-thioredoxin reductase catalytic subunit
MFVKEGKEVWVCVCVCGNMKKMKGMKKGRLCECALGQTRQKRERQNIKKEKAIKRERGVGQ